MELGEISALLRLLIVALVLTLGCSPSQQPSSELATPPSVNLTALDPFLSQTVSNAYAAVQSTPRSADAWGRLGHALDAAGFARDAQSCYERASALDPQAARWLYLGSLSQLQDDPSVGLSNLFRAVELVPATNEAPRLRLAQALIERGRFTEASAQLQRLLAMNANHPAARVELARIALSSNQLARVEELLGPSMTNAYTARPALLLLSQAKQRLGDTAGADTLARRAAAMPRPFDWPDPYLREVQALRADESHLADRANALAMQGRFAEAERILNELLLRTPDHPEALLLLGRLRIQQRRCADAELLLQRHLARRTNSLHGFVQLGLARFCEGRWTDAADAFRQATRLKPDFAQAHYDLGLALARAGNTPAAIESYQNAIRCDPADANAHAAIAEEFLRANNPGSARRHAENALRLDPKHAKAIKLLERLN
jgi:cytochrome c-type biogenesis protein CcmH/NrfG